MSDVFEQPVFPTLLSFNCILKDLIEEFGEVSCDLLLVNKALEAFACHSEPLQEHKEGPNIEKLEVETMKGRLSDFKASCEETLTLIDSLTEETGFDELPIAPSILEAAEILEKYCFRQDLAGVNLTSILEYEYERTGYKWFLERVGAFGDNVHANTINRLTHVSGILNKYLDNIALSPQGKGGQGTLSPLTKKARLIRDKLKTLPEGDAMTRKEILDWLAGLDDPIYMDEGRFNKIRKELLPYGLQNKPRIGYYFPKITS